MPRGNRVLILRPVPKKVRGEEKTVDAGYTVGAVYNMPPHIATKLVSTGYAEFYRAPKKA